MRSKAELEKRWGDILQETIARLPKYYELYSDSVKNSKWDFNPFLHSDYRFLAVSEYLLNKNVTSFKENLRKAVSFEMELLEKYDEGAPIHPSLVSMNRFKELFDALASGDMALAQKYASYMGGRLEAEEEYDDEFVLSLGYSLKYAVENNLELLKAWLPRLKAFCEDPKNRMSEFMGYPLVLEALLERDLEKTNAAFQVLLDGHKKKCRSRKGPDYGYYFHDSPDADLFVWGIGLANLCRHYGLDVQISDPLIPEELLIPVNQDVCDKKESNSLEIKRVRPEQLEQMDIELSFSTFYQDLWVGGLNFRARFPIPLGWANDEEAASKMEMLAILVPDGKRFSDTDVFIVIYENELGYEHLSEETVLEEGERHLIEDGWVKDVYLSSIKTYDNRSISVLTYENKDLKYVHKSLILPFREDLSEVLIIGFNIKNFDTQKGELWFPAMEALIRGCKFTEISQDLKEKHLYIEGLIKKGIDKYFEKLPRD